MSVFIVLLLTVQSHTKVQRDSQKPLIQLGLSCISQLHCVHRAKYVNDSNAVVFFFQFLSSYLTDVKPSFWVF